MECKSIRIKNKFKYVPTSAEGAALAICLWRGAGDAGAETTTNESVRLVSDLLVRSPPSWLASVDKPVLVSMDPDSLESPILPPPDEHNGCRFQLSPELCTLIDSISFFVYNFTLNDEVHN